MYTLRTSLTRSYQVKSCVFATWAGIVPRKNSLWMRAHARKNQVLHGRLFKPIRVVLTPPVEHIVGVDIVCSASAPTTTVHPQPSIKHERTHRLPTKWRTVHYQYGLAEHNCDTCWLYYRTTRNRSQNTVYGVYPSTAQLR